MIFYESETSLKSYRADGSRTQLVIGFDLWRNRPRHIRRLTRYYPGLIFIPQDLPDDPALLEKLLEQILSERESDKGKIVHLEEENALLRQRP